MQHTFHSLVAAMNAVLILLGLISAFLILHFDGSWWGFAVPAFAAANFVAVAQLVRGA